MGELVLTVSYDGTAYSGYARQLGQDGRDRVVTVQGELERALDMVLRRETHTVCAGRTDAGVHALGQQVGLAVSAEEVSDRDLAKLARSVNALTPDDIVVTDARLEPAGFNPRFDAISREYRYRVVTGRIPPVFLEGYVWWVRCELDVPAMRDAAVHLIGEHDFRSFCLAVDADELSTTVRRLESVDIFPEEHLGESCLTIRVVGNAFLHNMVRIVAGTLVDVGRGHHDPTWVREVLPADVAVPG